MEVSSKMVLMYSMSRSEHARSCLKHAHSYKKKERCASPHTAYMLAEKGMTGIYVTDKLHEVDFFF